MNNAMRLQIPTAAVATPPPPNHVEDRIGRGRAIRKEEERLGRERRAFEQRCRKGRARPEDICP